MTATSSRLPGRATDFARLGLGALVLSAVALVAVPSAASAVTASYSNSTPVAIPDATGGDCVTNTSNGLVTSTITVPDSGTIQGVNVGLNITHTYRSDLIVDLTSPTGTTIRLVDRVQRTSGCGPDADNIVANLSDDAGSSIEGYGAAGASYTPMQALSAFIGQNAAGNWKLSVYDVSTEDTGTLNSWSLAIDTGSSFSVADVSQNEGALAVFTVTRTAPATETESVDYATADGTAHSGLDYVATSGTLTFAPGQTTATVSVPLLNDDLHEGDEAFSLVLSNPQGPSDPVLGNATAIGTILDDDVRPELSIADLTAAENDGTATLTVTRTGALGGTDSVGYASADDSAEAGSDYTPTSGTLTFSPGQSTATISVPLVDDAVFEGDESFTVALANPASATGPAPTLGNDTATVTLTDDDARPELSIASASATEGDTSLSLTVTRTGALGGTDSVDYTTSDDSAEAGADYTATSGTLSFSPGQSTATISVPLLDDAVFEGDESFTVSLANPASSTGVAPTIGTGTATGTLVDDESRADLTIAGTTVSDTDGSVTLTVKRSGALGGNDSVDFVTRSGTARAGTHFTRTSGTLVFAPGAATATITVPIADGAVHGTKRAFTVELSNPKGDPTPTVSKAAATVTITDAAPAVVKLPRTGASYGVLSGLALLLVTSGLVLVLRRRSGRAPQA